MITQRMVVACALMITLSVLTAPRVAEAQELACGISCATCGYMMSQGVHEDDQGQYEIQCESFASCGELDCGELVSATHPSSVSLLDLINGAQPQHLAAVVDEHGDRLLLHQDRNLLVVLHRSACEPDILARNIQSIAFLSDERIEKLDILGVRHLEEFVAEMEALKP